MIKPNAQILERIAAEAIERAICYDRCAFKKLPACWQFRGDPWPNPKCNDPGCHSEALAAVATLKAGGII